MAKKNSHPQRDNCVMVPRIINTLGLSLPAYRLYCHIKDVAGEHGHCYQSTQPRSWSEYRTQVATAKINCQTYRSGPGRGLEMVVVYQSAWKGANQKRLTQILDDARAGKFHVQLC